MLLLYVSVLVHFVTQIRSLEYPQIFVLVVFKNTHSRYYRIKRLYDICMGTTLRDAPLPLPRGSAATV